MKDWRAIGFCFAALAALALALVIVGLALLMGASSIGGVVLYGIGSSSKGHPAPNIAFGIFMSFLVLSGVGIGLASGELRGLPAQRKAVLALSVAGLISGAWLLRLS